MAHFGNQQLISQAQRNLYIKFGDYNYALTPEAVRNKLPLLRLLTNIRLK